MRGPRLGQLGGALHSEKCTGERQLREGAEKGKAGILGK